MRTGIGINPGTDLKLTSVSTWKGYRTEGSIRNIPPAGTTGVRYNLLGTYDLGLGLPGELSCWGLRCTRAATISTQDCLEPRASDILKHPSTVRHSHVMRPLEADIWHEDIG